MLPGAKRNIAILVSAALVALAVLVVFWPTAEPARALPTAGHDLLNVTAEASVASRLGQETISLTGLIELMRSDPRMDGDVEVVDIEIVGISLTGESITGPIIVSQNGALTSEGEIRSHQPPPVQFPASLAIDIFINIEIPVSGGSPPTVHNDDPLELTTDGPIEEWPPIGATLLAEPGAPSGSHCAGADGSGGIPLLPSLPAEFCVISVSMTIGTPKTPTPTHTPCPIDVCTPVPSPTITPTSTIAPTDTPAPTPTPRCVPAVESDNVFSFAPVLPVTIPDGVLSLQSCILVSDAELIEDLNVDLRIGHGLVGDLVITLLHEESGISVNLIDRPGRAADGFGFGCSQDDLDVTLNDEASLPAEDQCEPGIVAISGSLQPNEPLSAFDGSMTQGTWLLRIVDVSAGGSGTLIRWRLIVNESEATIGDTNCDGSVTAIDAVLILQLVAGLVPSLACEAAADTNGDGATDARDAALILQFTAGLLGSIGPPPTSTSTPSPEPSPTPVPPTSTPTEVQTPVPPTSTPIPGPQPNDNFANAIQIASLPFNTSEDTNGATTEGGEDVRPDGCFIIKPNSKGATIWYRFTAPTTTTIRAETTGSDFDTVIAIYSGNDLDSLVTIGCDDDGDLEDTQSELTVPVVGGTTYHIQVGGFDGRSGNLVLQLVDLAPTPKP